MGFVDCASKASAYRGYEYFKENRVIEVEKIDDTHFSSKVKGSIDTPYEVIIDIEHPRKCSCNCPLAEGRMIVCKHKIATYFSVFPDKAETYQKNQGSYYYNNSRFYDDDYYYDEDDECYDEDDEYYDEYYDEFGDDFDEYFDPETKVLAMKKIKDHISSMDADELKQSLFDILMNGPKKQWKIFMLENHIDLD